MLGMCIAASFFHADHAQAQAQAIQEYRYEPGRIYPIRTGLGITTAIELSPNENVLDYSLGFSSGWDVSRRDNVFYLRPKNVDVDTNMMVRTETNAYIFELKVVATDWRALEQAKQAGVQYKVVFNYPADASFAVVKEAPKPAEASTALDPSRLYNFNYDYSTRSKASWLVPVSVYDDGRFTYIKMNDMRGIPTGNFPAVYGRESKRSEEFLLNTTVEDNTIIVHGIHPYLLIRQGNNVIGLRRGSHQ
ncbi:type IV secretion system protein VirB9 [Lysobacter pythonis]|uniref:Type IV secretion system protein VirB9 n=1 Tax=Solilutibacter pythonis TaxID=2483112 RepID=A0A3M2HMX6_9GAMM|nr:TrbG/VirB9 family P-type conjugative transfer protein [Lysobacter pythonis]RMH91061.1 type IV secretion system protein VirB9 [Lysobacter pythonis]